MKACPSSTGLSKAIYNMTRWHVSIPGLTARHQCPLVQQQKCRSFDVKNITLVLCSSCHMCTPLWQSSVWLWKARGMKTTLPQTSQKEKKSCFHRSPHLPRAEAWWSWPSSWRSPHCQSWGPPQGPGSGTCPVLHLRCCRDYWDELCLQSGQRPPLCWTAHSPVSEAGSHWPLGLGGWGRETNVLLDHQSFCSCSANCRLLRLPKSVSQPWFRGAPILTPLSLFTASLTPAAHFRLWFSTPGMFSSASLMLQTVVRHQPERDHRTAERSLPSVDASLGIWQPDFGICQIISRLWKTSKCNVTNENQSYLTPTSNQQHRKKHNQNHPWPLQLCCFCRPIFLYPSVVESG